MARYSVTLTNNITGEVVVLTANDQFVLQSKVNKKRELWTQQNRKLQSSMSAKQQTEEAQKEIAGYQGILAATLKVDDKIDWEALKDNKSFDRSEPKLEDFFRVEGAKKFFGFVPMVKNKIDREEAEAKEKLVEAEKVFKKDKEKFYKAQKEFNGGLDQKRQDYESLRREGVQDYFHLVLERSKYPDSLILNYELAYDSESRVILVEVEFPHMEKVPKVTEYTYVQSKDLITQKEMKDKDFEVFYNDILYQIALRTVHEVLESDYSSAADLVVFNGFVSGTDGKTGQDFRNCVLSLQVKKDDFNTLNLEKITPRECFRYLKGVSAGSLISLAPVRPIMKLNMVDNRIIQANSILDGFDENTNLAVMPWEDFEVLVRDLIQKEFGTNGCKVEVTRASRDAGVDAIAFDEDPIRGGKFVIQAKRYNNLVPVSAVRDLYGTVVNEGAVKGILVTTSHYGPDALEFAKSKPLTLINGEQLLFLFNKHGYQVKIELQKKQAAASTVSY